jgi:hypothetical protein
MEHRVNLTAEAEDQLRALAEAKRLDADSVLQEILDEYLSDLRASMEADEVYARYLEGKEKTITLEEMEKRFGMEG